MPKTFDNTARRRRRARRKPDREPAARALVDGPNNGGLGRPLRDLSDVAGTWLEDPATDAALAAQDREYRETSLPKAIALGIIEALPPRSSWDDILEQLYVRKKIEAGLADADSGRVVSHGEVRRRFSRTR